MEGDDESWLRSFLVQQFVLQHDYTNYAEVLKFWEAGLIERVESLAGPELQFAEGLTIKEARAADRVHAALTRRVG